MPDGRVTVSVPSGAATQPLRLRATRTPDTGEVEPPKIAGIRRGFGTFFLHAEDVGHQAVHQFAQPLTLSLRYTPQQLQALDIAEDDLTLFWYNEALPNGHGAGTTGGWVTLPTTVDPRSHTASAQVSHFSDYQFSDGSPASSEFIPSLQGFQTSTFTGAATASIPIDTPAGPNGIKPQLQLNYDTTMTDGHIGMRDTLQAGWVGKGWSLDTGSIMRNKTQLFSNTYDYFSLVLNGQSFDLVRAEALVNNANSGDPTQWAWRPSTETYLKARIVSAPALGGRGYGTTQGRYVWKIWTKDGTEYDYGEDAWWGWGTCGLEAYRWALSQVTDVYGNTMHYGYNRLSSGVGCGTVDPDLWPTNITWGGNLNTGASDRYAFFFFSSARSIDTVFDKATNQNGPSPHESRRLDMIQVDTNSQGSWQLMRQWNLGYADASASLYPDKTINGNQVDAGYPKLTLKNVARIANDGSSNQPPTTFSYGSRGTNSVPSNDWNRLNQVTNGQGGTVSYTYEQIDQVTGKSVLSNHRRVTVRTESDGRTTPFAWHYSYTSPELNSEGSGGTNDSSATQYWPNSAPVYFSQHMGYTTDYTNALVHLPLWEFRGHQLVVETDPNGTQTKHFFFQGDLDASGNGCNPTGTGNATNINNDTCFQQLRDREFLKGREYDTQVWDSGGNKLAETQHSFTTTFMGYADEATGLWHAFVAEVQMVEMAWEATNTPVTKTINYFYDTSLQQGGGQYGNLTRIDEHDQMGTLVRSTEHHFNTLDDGTHFIVDRPDFDLVRDGNTNQQALTVYMYDGNTTSEGINSGVNSPGKLTLKRVYSNVPNQPSAQGMTLSSTDTSFQYDTYGNRTSVTSYAGAGTKLYNGTSNSFSGPGNGSTSWTTTTAYDSIFHALPISVTHPTVNGIALTESAAYDYRMGTLIKTVGPNGDPSTVNCVDVFDSTKAAYTTPVAGEVNCAQYYGYGRMIKRAKPGDSGQVPTVTVQYADWDQPVRYVVTQYEFAGSGATRPNTYLYDGLGRQIQEKHESQDAAQNIVTDYQYDGLNHVTKQSQPHYVSETPSTTFWYLSPVQADNVENWTTTSYDGLGRVFKTTNPDTSFTEDHWGIYNNLHYHDVVDANRHRTHWDYDSLGRLRNVYELTGECSTYWPEYNTGCPNTWANYATTTYTYNALDLLKTVTDALGNTTQITYDSAGRKTSIDDSDMGNWSYSYAANGDAAPLGNLTSQTDNKTQTIRFSYDALNRLIRKSYPNGQTASFGYDATTVGANSPINYGSSANFGRGQRTSMTNSTDTVNYQYDARGHQVREEYNVPALGSLRAFAHTFDSADRPVAIYYPDYEAMGYTYDAAWRPINMWSKHTGVNYVTGVQYTALNQPTSWMLGDGTIQTQSYSATTGRVQRIQVGTSGNLGQLFDMSYGYDPGGNVAAKTNNRTAEYQQFSYDERDRLTSWHGQ